MRSDSGKRTYISTTNRITTSGELKQRNDEASLRRRGIGSPYPALITGSDNKFDGLFRRYDRQ